jgi:iron complex transport system substrate-binding protein
MLSDIEPLYERVVTSAARRPPVAVFYPIWRGPYMTINRDTYIHDMLRVCGGRNVFADRSERYPTVTLDEVAAQRPAVILLPTSRFDSDARTWLISRDTPICPRCADGRIHLVDGKPFSWHGPRIADALRRLPGLIDPAATTS